MRKWVKVCPVCKSINVSPDLSIPAAVAYGALYNYRCNECGYVGLVFPEVLSEDLDDLKDEEGAENAYPLLSVSFGRGYFEFLRYLAFLGLFTAMLLYFTLNNPISMIAILLFLYLITFSFGREYLEKHRLIRFGMFVAIILYTIAYRIV